MFSWRVLAQSETTATPDQVFAKWKDVESWPTWDHALDWCKIDGPFQSGTKGKIKAKGYPVSKFKLLEVSQDRAFEDQTTLPLARMNLKHTIENAGDQTFRIRHEAHVFGPLAPLFWLVMRPKLKQGLRQALDRFLSQIS